MEFTFKRNRKANVREADIGRARERFLVLIGFAGAALISMPNMYWDDTPGMLAAVGILCRIAQRLSIVAAS